jgi:RNA polymerase sigma-70 factor (ECF subfamily)
MGYLRDAELGASFKPFAAFREYFGFVPKLFRAQSLLPRVIEAEAALASGLLFTHRALTQIEKERILLVQAAAHGSSYWVATHHQMLQLLGVPEQRIDQLIADYRQAGLAPAETALLDFTFTLGTRDEVTKLRAHGWSDESILEAVLTTAWGHFARTLAIGLGVAPDFPPRPVAGRGIPVPAVDDGSGPHISTPQRSAEEFAPFAFFREQFGFIPNIYRAQTLRPDVLEAEAGAIRAVLLSEDALTRVQKECILLVVSAANRNTYFVAVHGEIVRGLGIAEEESDQIAVDHQRAHLAAPNKALLDFARKLAIEPAVFRLEDMQTLRQHGFSDEQILEAVVMTALTCFLNTLQVGLGTIPDFRPRRVFPSFSAKTAHLLTPDSRLNQGDIVVDPDAEPVAKVQGGDLNAFEELINRHSRRVYRTLMGILGNPEEARDAMQDTFLKAFQHIGKFERRSRFGTWLVTIASNTGLQRLRERKSLASLDDDGFESDEGFRPRQIQAWTDDPEQLYSKAEMRTLVESSVMKLPAKYRVVLVLRDMEQLSNEEAAAALGLGLPALKARLLRGRLMVRETLAPHFAESSKGAARD